MSRLTPESESYYPSHASRPVDEIRIVSDHRPMRYDPIVEAARSAFGEMNILAYRRDLHAAITAAKRV